MNRLLAILKKTRAYSNKNFKLPSGCLASTISFNTLWKMFPKWVTLFIKRVFLILCLGPGPIKRTLQKYLIAPSLQVWRILVTKNWKLLKYFIRCSYFHLCMPVWWHLPPARNKVGRIKTRATSVFKGKSKLFSLKHKKAIPPHGLPLQMKRTSLKKGRMCHIKIPCDDNLFVGFFKCKCECLPRRRRMGNPKFALSSVCYMWLRMVRKPHRYMPQS